MHRFSSILKVFLVVLAMLPLTVWSQTSTPGLTFLIRNEQVVGNNYEFDIYMMATLPGSYHSRGLIYMNYNTQTFWPFMVTRGGVQYTQLSLLQGTVANTFNKYFTVNLVDNTSSRFAITWSSNFVTVNPSPFAHNEVPTTPTPLYHVSMLMQNTSGSPDVSFHYPLMEDEQYYLQAANTEFTYILSPLPLQWVDFQAEKKTGQQVGLSWVTEAEVNTSHFVVERKIGNEAFEEIAIVPAQGDNPGRASYTYLDQQAQARQLTYRLRQVDLDGAYSLSDTREVLFAVDEVIRQFNWGPNPFKDELQYRLNGLRAGWHELRMVDMFGRLVFQKTFHLEPGELQTGRIATHDWASGTYQVMLLDPGGKQGFFSKKLQKQ
jgi:hypothetical protein